MPASQHQYEFLSVRNQMITLSKIAKPVKVIASQHAHDMPDTRSRTLY